MLKATNFGNKRIGDYREFFTSGQWEELQGYSKKLKGRQVIHVNATPIGGGVAEILQVLVPLEQDLGIDSKWFYIGADADFFATTKKMHNSLQGSESVLGMKEKQYYLDVNARVAEEINRLNPDIVSLQDPQPLAAGLHISGSSIISRIHIDLTRPNPRTVEFIVPMLERCKKVIFSSNEFVPKGFSKEKIVISAPGIDPLSEKNFRLPQEQINEICTKVGIHPEKPLLVQISRFDPWKDPLGVVKAYQEVKKEFPEIQLVLSGVIEAQDDPEAELILEEVRRQTLDDSCIFLFYTLDQIPEGISLATFINALQARADVVFQKSLREGFALTATESLWKEQPVVAGNVGGLKLQIIDGENGFLVNSPEDAAQRAVQLLRDSELKRRMGQVAYERVKERFLITRMLLDELKIMAELPSPF